MDAELKKATFMGLTKDSVTTIVAAVFMIGVAWTKLGDVERSISAVADQVGSLNKAQIQNQIDEKLLEGRVLNLETQRAKSPK
jgi:hypothetical protein